MNGWRRSRLKFVADVNTAVLSEDTPDRFEFTYVDISNVTQGSICVDSEPIHFGAAPSRARRLALPGDSVVSTVRTYLRAVAAVPEFDQPVVFSTGFAVLQPSGVHPRFLSWYLQGDDFVSRIEANSTGVSYPAISASQLMALDLRLPQLEEQRAIADYLDRETAQIDELIAEQQRLIELLRERRQSVIGRAVFGLDLSNEDRRELKIIGRHRAIEPLLERIPSHWRVQRFKTLMARLNARNTDLSFPMMSLKSTGEVVLRSATGERQEPNEASLPRYLVARVDDLVVNPMWLIGGAIGVSRVDGAVSPDYRVFRSLGGQHPRYMHHLLRSRPYLDQYVLYTRAQTTFDRRVQQPDLDNMPLPVPPMTVQVEIAKRIDGHLDRIDGLIRETEALIELAQERRSALISAAVTGQIDVEEGVA